MANEKLKILRMLIENQEKNLSIRQVSKLREINYKSAYNSLQKLKEEGIVDLIRIGNTINCKFNHKFDESVFLAEYDRRKDLLKNRNFKIICKDLDELPFSFIALLFGSYASKEQRRHSDVDLLVVGGDEDKIKRAVSLYPSEIHLSWVDHKDFLSMAKSREFNVVGEAMRKNIILVGIEDYYRLLQNAR